MEESPRSTKIFNQLYATKTDTYTSGKRYISSLQEMFTQYNEVMDDILKTKKRYAELINRYTGTLVSKRNPSSLPGIVSGGPTYSNESMKQDGEEMKKIDALLKELYSQRDTLYSQVRKLLEATISTTSNYIDTTNQMSDVLDELISQSDPQELYRSPEARY